MYIYDRQSSGSPVGFVSPSIAHALGDTPPTAAQTYAAQPAITELTDATFWNIFSERNKVVVVSFWTDTCPPCDEVARVLASVAENTSKRGYRDRVKFYQIQWDAKVNPQIRQRFGLKGMPVVYFYYTATGVPPTHAAPLLEGSLGPEDKWHDLEEYEFRIKSILRHHGHTFEARIQLIDLARYFSNNSALRDKFVKSLEAKFNNLAPRWLFDHLLRFRVSYQSHEPTLQEKANFGRLDFPMYLLGQQHTESRVKQLLREHQIPATVQCPRITRLAEPIKLVESCWREKQVRGCGIPPGQGFRKVGFIKTHTVATDRIGKRDLPQAFLNVTSHELGHMFNICDHSAKGLMKYPVPLDVNVDFSEGDKGFVLGSLVRLRDL